jgi:hypothetical protein
MPDIDLEPTRYRRVFDKPLARPRLLWSGFAVFGIGTALGVWAAYWYGAPWGALIPVPCAIGLGVAIAGLFPGYFFNDDRN